MALSHISVATKLDLDFASFGSQDHSQPAKRHDLDCVVADQSRRGSTTINKCESPEKGCITMNEEIQNSPSGHQENVCFTIIGSNTEITICCDYRDEFEIKKNMLNVRISARVFDSQIVFSPMIGLNTLQVFMHDIIKCYTDLEGILHFHPEGDWLDLEGKIDKGGHIHWKGWIRYKREYDLRLRFTFQSDQSYLPALLDQLDQVFQYFPLFPELSSEI